MIINPYLVQPGVPPFTGLLDTYSGASVAYSAARRLSSTYTGPLIRVRRSSDNTEQDIGYNGSNVLDESALTTFVGANDGFVTTWYDQSGNANNATQSTAANQPKIVDSSTGVIKDGSIPAIYNNVSSHILYLNTAINLGTAHSFFAVLNRGSIAKEYLGDFGLGRSASWAFYQNTGEYGAQNSAGSPTVALSLDRCLNVLTKADRTTIKNYENGSQLGVTYSTPLNNDFWLSNLGGENTSYAFIGYLQETIIYPTDQATNRSSIESNINTFYSIY